MSAFASSLLYRSRVCIEGVPDHAHQVKLVLHLFPKQSFIEEINLERETVYKLGCFIVWVWSKDPMLRVAEPVEPSEDYFVRLENMELQELCTGLAAMLDYEVILHLDRVVDYSPYKNNISGVPTDELEEEWPVRHHFMWHHGFVDGCPTISRASVHSRLGGGGDHCPPSGCGVGGSGTQ